MGDRTHIRPGSPIRTPSDHSSFDSSPRPFAAYHVLHRLLVPRHPPCALKNLATKMLASTVQISNTHRHISPAAEPPAVAVATRYGHPEETRYRRQQPSGCSFRTQQCAEPEQAHSARERADSVFDVPPVSAGTTTNGWSTGRPCTGRAHPVACSCAMRGSLERR